MLKKALIALAALASCGGEEPDTLRPLMHSSHGEVAAPDCDCEEEHGGHTTPPVGKDVFAPASTKPQAPVPGWGPDGFGPGLVKAAIPPASHDGWGNFRITDPEPCAISHRAPDDPIVFPNMPGAAHMHDFFGNTSTDAFSTLDSLEATKTVSCPGGVRNKSAYWYPTLFDGAGKPMDPTKLFYYHKSAMLPRASLKTPPYGLRFVFGGDLHSKWPRSTSWQGCAKSKQTFKDCLPGQEVHAHISGPQCWDGKRLDSPDHRSHMAYPEHIGGGKYKCPATHPVPLPQPTIVAFWKIPASGTAGMKLSSDQPGDLPGQSLHADIFYVWNPTVFDRFMKGCIWPGKSCNLGNLGDGWRLVKI